VEEELSGRLLLASPALTDPSFAGSVVLVLDADESGALGVVVNRPTDIEVASVLPAWADGVGQPATVFRGGPVAPENALALGLLATVPSPEDPEPPGWRGVRGSLGLVDLDVAPQQLMGSLAALRVFAGYAGWGPGQLEGELALDAWIVIDALPGDPFSPRPEQLWRRVLRRQPGRTSLLSTWVADPTLN
jgi:putative transcriptional regulator